MHARSLTASPGRWSSPLAALLAALLASACTGGGPNAAKTPGGGAAVPGGDPVLRGLLPELAALPLDAPAVKPRQASAAQIILPAAAMDSLLPRHEAYASLIDETARYNAAGSPGGPLSGYA